MGTPRSFRDIYGFCGETGCPEGGIKRGNLGRYFESISRMKGFYFWVQYPVSTGRVSISQRPALGWVTLLEISCICTARSVLGFEQRPCERNSITKRATSHIRYVATHTYPRPCFYVSWKESLHHDTWPCWLCDRHTRVQQLPSAMLLSIAKRVAASRHMTMLAM